MDSKSGKSWLFGLGRGPAGRQGLRRWNECEKGGERAFGVLSLVAGQAKWKFQLKRKTRLRKGDFK